MDKILYEINNHKFNIISLANKLISASNINDEIFINNEIKKETGFLLSLLNIKNKVMMNQMGIFNNMNIFNPMMNPNFVNFNNQMKQLMQQLMQMQQIIQQQQMQQEMPFTHKKEEIISILFSNNPNQTVSVKYSVKEKFLKL